ncbi:DNA-binding response OmpR family regulator [Luteibacter sp. HA06]
MAYKRPLAVVIEPVVPLATMVASALAQRGYEVVTSATHAGAASLVAARDRVDFLVAAVPAPEEDQQDTYLRGARQNNTALAMVVTLPATGERDNVPPRAVTLCKPFDLAQLSRAVEDATFPPPPA